MGTFVIEGHAAGTIRDLIDQMARTRGDNVFLISPETGRTLTFAGLRQEAKAISARLRQAGLERGDKVAFLMDNGLFTVQLFLGTMYSGLVTVPLNVRAGVDQLAYTLDHSDAKVLFIEGQYAALAREALAAVSRSVQVITADAAAFATDETAPLEDALFEPLAAEDVALLMYTSGSVGQPKAAIHSHRTILAHGRNSMGSHRLTSADRSLLVLPLYHINAECVTLMPTLLSGGSVVVPYRFSVSQFWDWLDQFSCTWTAVVPTILAQLLDWQDPHADSRQAAFERIRFIRSSSAPLSPSLQREFISKFNLLLIQAMGSSEAGNIFSNPQPPGENKIGTPGLAWGFETRIIGPNGADVAAGEPGEVLLRGEAVMQGYYKDPEQTAAVLDADGWLHTGDLAYRDQDGYFFVIGRSKELIIKGGVNIAPRQIDDVIESHPAVLEAAVVGVPDRYVGEDLVAFAVLRTGMTGDEREMLAFCESRLGHFKTPTRIHFVTDLPKGPSGKVQRLRLLTEAGHPAAAIAAMYNNGSSVPDPQPAAAGDSIEEMITQNWAEILRQPEVDAASNFFSLGGDSLMAIQCLSKMRERLPVAISLSDFFENPTVAQQAAFVRQRLHTAKGNGGQVLTGQPRGAGESSSTRAAASSEPIPVRGRNLPYPLSPGQQRIWFFEELVPEVPLYNECEAARLVGDLKAEALERALNVVIDRHEILRTTIKTLAEAPMAIVHESRPLAIKQIDLSGLPPPVRDEQLQRLLIEEPRLPYHLEAEPGIRATLIRLDQHEHVFIIMMHHLVCDWASLGVLWRELSLAYSATVRAKPLALDPLPIQHGDLAVWQRQQVDENRFAEDLAFWQDNLRGAPELLELPYDRPRPAIQSYRGAKRRFALSPKLTEALRTCSKQEKTSLFTVFAAAFNALVYRYTGVEDIPLGIPIGDRERPELQSMIGFLIQTHVLRTQLSGDMKFRDLLPIVQKGLLALYSHREAPFDQVVGRIDPNRSLSHAPLFQVMINWRDGDQQFSSIGLDGLAVELVLAEARTAKFDLTLLLTDDERAIWLEAEYNTDLFDHDRIDLMFGHYQTLLEAVASAPDTRLAELPLLTATERNQLLVEWNATSVAYPRALCVHQLFERQATLTPGTTAVVFGDSKISYRELDQRSNQLARHLRKLGVEPDDLVAICVERSIEMMIGLLGILKAGGAYVPLDPAYPQERLAFMLRDSGASLVLTQDKLRRQLSGDHRTVYLDSDWPLIAREETSAPDSKVSADNLAYVIYTSGSTGQPKGVEITHGSVVNLLSSMSKQPGLRATDTLLAVTTLSFDIAGLELFLPLAVGARLVIASRATAADGVALLELLKKSRATVIQATPITFRILLEAGWSSREPRVKVMCGGEALPSALADQILERAGELWNCYGPTETTIWSTVLQVSFGRPITIGRPIDNTQLYILDSTGAPCPIGRPGELHIGGAGLARGYFRRPDLTAEKFITNAFSSEPGSRLYKTGDLVRYLRDGNIEYLGRMDHQVKIHGYRIELGEIESALRHHPGITQSVVVARGSGAENQRLVAYIVPSNQDATPGVTELRALLKRTLPEYMIPKAFVTLEQLPLTSNGKIDRKALPEPELGRTTSEVRYVAPRTALEFALAEIWRGILGLQEVGINDDFFALGGHSLQATQLLGKVYELLDHQLSVLLFFQNPTIHGMAKVLQNAKQGASSHQLIPLKRGNAPGTLFFLDAGIDMCRLAQLLTAGPSSFATGVPLPHAALEAVALNQNVDFPALENLAAAHVALIRNCHRSGPCMLAGYSFGGVLAFEVAHQLQREGIPVELILMLDSWAATPPMWQKLRVLSMDRGSSRNPGRNPLWSVMRTRIPKRVARLAFAKSSDISIRPAEDADILFGEVTPIVFQKLLRGIRKAYRYSRLDCGAVLFRCQEDAYSTHTLRGKMGWDGLFTRKLEIIETPGNHASLLREPHLQALARRIDDRLAELSQQQRDEANANLQPMQRRA